MRVMAWNTGWNVSPAKVNAQTDAVAELNPDVAFFSEWSPSPTRTISGGRTRGSGGHTRGPALQAKGLVHQCQQHVLDYAGDGRDWRKLYWGSSQPHAIQSPRSSSIHRSSHQARGSRSSTSPRSSRW